MNEEINNQKGIEESYFMSQLGEMPKGDYIGMQAVGITLGTPLSYIGIISFIETYSQTRELKKMIASTRDIAYSDNISLDQLFEFRQDFSQLEDSMRFSNSAPGEDLRETQSHFQTLYELYDDQNPGHQEIAKSTLTSISYQLEDIKSDSLRNGIGSGALSLAFGVAFFGSVVYTAIKRAKKMKKK